MRPSHRLRLFAFLFPVALFAAAPRAGLERPNFLVIVADDLNWRDLGCTGSPDVKSPHIDRLASESMSLRRMFTPAPTCSPLRHALYTGLFPIRSGAYPNHTMAYDGTRSVFGHLREHGYRVGLQNKSHVAPAASFPYEVVSGNADDVAAFRGFITRDAKQPWLAVFASSDPHSPWDRGPRNLYDPARITVPPYLHDNAVTRRNLAAYFAEISALDRQVGDCLAALDATGQRENTVVIFLSEQGSSFPFGGKWSLYDTGIRAATFIRWPGRIRAGSASDALIQYVDVAPTLLEIAGLDPVKVDTGCADADGKRGFDGKSFLPVLLGKAEQLREVVFAQHTTVGINGYREPYPIRAARDARYKYIRNLAPGNTYDIAGIHRGEIIESWQADARDNPVLAARVAWLFKRPAEELYDVEADPFETRNLAADASLGPVKARLSSALDAWMRQQGDKGMETELAATSRQPRAAERAEKTAPKERRGKAR